MPAAQSQLSTLIRREIQAAGPVSFARFMELALYHPMHGYYERPSKQIGCQADFYTSVSVGTLFGRLLAFQFARWLDALPSGAPGFQIVEAGAHDGQLASDVLSWFLTRRPDLLDRLEYWIIEPSTVRCPAQAAKLGPFGDRVRWFSHWGQIEPSSLSGVVFANELLDAFPFFRLGWDASLHRWFEWRVDWVGDQFAWARSPNGNSPELNAELATDHWKSLPPPLLAVLPNDFTVEVCPAARSWWSDAAARLAAGNLLTFDYGLDWEERFASTRPGGTLRSYRSHQVTLDPLANPGEQDLTAHIDFTGLIQSAERLGFKTVEYGAQGRFLTGLARDALEDLSQFGPWTQADTRQFQSLTHPNQLGSSFRVLLQSQNPLHRSPRKTLTKT